MSLWTSAKRSLSVNYKRQVRGQVGAGGDLGDPVVFPDSDT